MKLNINGNIMEIEDSILSKAIEDKQESIDINNDLVIRTKADEAKFSANTRTEGISVGAEIGRKEVLKGFGIEGEGQHKTDASSIAAIKTYSEGLVSQALVDAKIAPDKKVSELTLDIETLKATNATLTTAKETQASEFKTFKNNQLIGSALANEIPDNAALDNNRMLTLMRSEIKIDINENGVLFGIGNDGEPLKDANRDLLPVKTIVANFFDNNNDLLKSASGGAGGGDSGGGSGKQTTDEFIDEMKEQGHAPNSPAFDQIMNQRISAGTLDMS